MVELMVVYGSYCCSKFSGDTEMIYRVSQIVVGWFCRHQALNSLLDIE